MCCFSGAVESVSDTQIFARAVENGRQLLVYAMHLQTNNAVAMVLPLPVPADTKDDAVRFISLKEYPDFFADMKRGFSEPRPSGKAHTRGLEAADVLEVV